MNSFNEAANPDISDIESIALFIRLKANASIMAYNHIVNGGKYLGYGTWIHSMECYPEIGTSPEYGEYIDIPLELVPSCFEEFCDYLKSNIPELISITPEDFEVKDNLSPEQAKYFTYIPG